MQRTKIEWCDYTWNPVVGCENGCSYCYAAKMNDRFSFIPDFRKPQFFESRLNDPLRFRKPLTIFVISMGDVFSKSVPGEWVERIIEICRLAHWHTFMFLTKNPEQYVFYSFPKNCVLGVTVESEEFNERILLLKQTAPHNRKFVSIEPILGLCNLNLNGIETVITGAMSGPKAIKPRRLWVRSVIESTTEKQRFWKESMLPYLLDDEYAQSKVLTDLQPKNYETLRLV